ncbi:MAG TPA: DUF6485 family protein [Atribacteraceae bacterium]|nr:DUF6485 family protein [Atribacteraceae bacterium]
MPECKRRKNLDHCTCTYDPCSRKGLCCDCFSYHRLHGEIPGCLFPPDIEKTYDRSITRYLLSCRSR